MNGPTRKSGGNRFSGTGPRAARQAVTYNLLKNSVLKAAKNPPRPMGRKDNPASSTFVNKPHEAKTSRQSKTYWLLA